MKYVEGLVSVVMPTYKRSEKLIRAIDSVLNQTYSHLELLLVNDNDPFDEYTQELKIKLNRYINDDRLHLIIQDKHITNVGVTGGYGTGKSSIIHSYFNELKSRTSIYISLAHFGSLAGNTLPTPQDDKTINSQIDNILEMKIVNQLVNQIEPDKIPKANFLTKKNINNYKIISYSLSIIFLIRYFKFLLTVIT